MPSRRSDNLGFAIGNSFEGPAPDVYLGIDPGLNRTGYAVVRRTPNGPKLVEGGVVRSSPKESLSSRVHEIGGGVREILLEYQPAVLIIEQVFSMPRNPQTAMLMAHARGAILFCAQEQGTQLISYSPRQVKKLLTGSGTATKEQVQAAVQRELGLRRVLEPNDVADACAMALCHYHSCRLELNIT
ncbi:MAG: crossover junction endodeoxyribonuclease RuvC [Planctomycetaceae bacterium]